MDLAPQAPCNEKSDEIRLILKKAIDIVVDNSEYKHSKVVEWNGSILEYALRKITALPRSQPYKYIVTCKIIQNNGHGYHSCSTGTWNPQTDEHITYKFDTNNMIVVVDVFSLAASS
ncbi:flagellar inner arm dynein light chain Tctex1 [Dimargaris cristalligena]|uniref:Flagellar inner arm dynein light chain Tctex1 n=1 Tax=Dimargaris cristalligena TaxID=215637 RepID=A0A4P9ZPS4_9FUNG|nr:flagellar inner arm dynein light chain Tctex1 [Dimargaris cristalligena]|eukprot:RKP34602.1 flagellar inner arm dynein light chain Tctex1 [Dimargaris cristalligena]